MLKELQVFPSRKQKLPSLTYSKEELEQQLKEQVRLNRHLKQTRPFQLESIPHDAFDIFKTDLTQPALQQWTEQSLTLLPVPHFATHTIKSKNVINEEVVLDIENYRAKRRKILEPSPPPPPPPPEEQPQTINTAMEQVETNGNAVIVQQQQTSAISEQPQLQAPIATTPAVVPQTTPTLTTPATVTEPIHTEPIDTTNSDIDTWYCSSDLLSSATYTYPVCWVPFFATQAQISYCEAQSHVNSDSASQFLLAFDRILEYLNYPLNGEISLEEDTLNEFWSSSEKLKLLKGLIDRFADQDMCIAVLTVDMDGESFLLELLQISGYECSRICNVIGDDLETEYGAVFYTHKNKEAAEFNDGVDVAFIMDPRILRGNPKKNITTLHARHDFSSFAPLCYFVTMGSVEERALRWIIRDGESTSTTDEDIKRILTANNIWPLCRGGENKFVFSNLISWLESKSKLDYAYRSKRELPGSTRIEPVIINKQPTTSTLTETVTTTTNEETTTTTTTTITPATSSPPVTTASDHPVAIATTTLTAPAVMDNTDISDMDVSSDEEDRSTVPSDYIKNQIEKIFPEFTVNKTRLVNGEQAQSPITELDKKVVDNINQGLLQEYLKSTNEAQERFEREIKELKEHYKKLALIKAIELYN